MMRLSSPTLGPRISALSIHTGSGNGHGSGIGSGIGIGSGSGSGGGGGGVGVAPPGSATMASAAAVPMLAANRSGEIAQRWMEMVLGDKLDGGFPRALLSGEALCALANKVYMALGMRDKHCHSRPTTWPQATPTDKEDAEDREVEAYRQRASETREDDELAVGQAGTSGEMWLQEKATARANVVEYLRACEIIGVVPQDLFEPEDLLELRGLDKVYHNILALQSVAVLISHRRSIDDRSSIATTRKTQSVAASPPPSVLGSMDTSISPRSRASADTENLSWERLLAEYEDQQLKKTIADEKSGDPSAMEGIGKLAHDIWFTEEKIRALLLRDEEDAGGVVKSAKVAEELVPHALHGKLWMLTSGAAIEMRRHKGQYERLLSMEVESTDSTRQIDADLHRTVPDEDRSDWSDEKSAMMRRVLVAYSFFNPTLGYCQGLNYIVARLLLFVGEEEAFYLLIKLIRLVPDDYYTTMLGLAVDQHVFADLVRIQTPQIAEHLNELGGSGMELSLACTEWFLTLFASPCEKEVTVRIWDTIFLMGDEMLFRIALALMQLDSSKLLKCNTYGDMLKHLNEIGRGSTDVVQLLRDSRHQDCVFRARIEDFRAHHRLQLAAGIAVSSVEVDSASSGHDHRVGSKEDTKAKLFGSKKRPGLFNKPLDKQAGRQHRTFDRFLTSDYSEALQKEHPTFSCYYDGRPPIVFDMYWGSSASYTQWGKRNYRRINEISSTKEPKEERRRLQSDGSGLSGSQRTMDSFGGPPIGHSGLSRERRSKSTAFIQPQRASHNAHQQSQHGKKPVDEESHLSKSPKGWFQRIEGWHKDLKIQKEKKKAEKMKQRLGHEHGVYGYPIQHPSVRDRHQNQTFTATPPSWRHVHENEQLPRGNSFDGHHIGAARPRADKRSESMDVQVARSYSDPFLSPNDVYGKGPWEDPSRPSLGGGMDAEIIMRSQEPDKAEFNRPSSVPNHQGGGIRMRSFKTISLTDDLHGLRQRESMDAPSSSRFRDPQHAYPEPSLASPALSEISDDDDRGRHFDIGKPPAHMIPEIAAPTIRRASTRGLRTVSTDFADDMDDERGSLSQPVMRRIASLPLSDQAFAPARPGRKITADTARVIRERAQVLSYMQRKASDASSITSSSIPRTPRERCDTGGGRLSLSSAGSSPCGAESGFALAPRARYPTGATSNASSSTPPAPPLPHLPQSTARKSSFSFFDKLSLDMESHLGGLHAESALDDSLDQALFGDWSPSSGRNPPPRAGGFD